MIHPATSNAIIGAVELFLGRPGALRRFDISVEGFWHSFRAIWFVLPLFAISAAVEHRMLLSDAVVENVSDGVFIAARLVDFAVDWIAMPVLLALFAGRLGIARFYAGYIVVRNWSLIVMSAPQALISLLLGIGLLPLELSALLSLLVLGAMIQFHYRILRMTLGKPMAFNIGFVIADMALSLVLSKVIDQLFGF